jgi:hypothetical protein
MKNVIAPAMCYLAIGDDLLLKLYPARRVGRPPINLFGQLFDTLHVVARAGSDKRGMRWLCRCEDCGEELIAGSLRLREDRVFCPCTGKKPPATGRPRGWRHQAEGTRPECVQAIAAQSPRHALRSRIARDLGVTEGSPAADRRRVAKKFWKEIEGSAAAA